MNHSEQLIRSLTMILLYLTSWEESDFERRDLRAWKGYDFDVLNELEDKGLISVSHKAKSVYLSEKGIAVAKKLLKDYGLSR
ncbi:DUF6429 family protein [Sporolactobacillus sp. Y61]|uniref:DUF6429 family protein n=1 Tax=Sporolactobacillus sp. Y61 TaxID=3160863 RepID=A0AAU8IB23_9BACL